MPQDLWSLSGGTYLIEKPDLAFQRESLGLSSCQGLQVQTPQPRNKKPGVERRAQPLFLSVAPREARQSLPCVRRCLTLGSDYCPADPTVNPLISPADLGIPRTICNYTETSPSVKPLAKLFFGVFLRVWKARKTLAFRSFLGPLVALVLWRFCVFFPRASAVQGSSTPTERE